MKDNLTIQLASLSDAVFWRCDKPTVPDFNGIFYRLALETFGKPLLPCEALLDGRLPNLSSFQRAVAREAQRRRREQIPA